jgi:hypothetical protein
LTLKVASPMKAFRAACCVLLIALGAGVSTSGSCVVAYCSEDCDPCLTQCKCTHECHHTSASFQATHALVDFVFVETRSGERTVRTFGDVLGLSVRAAGGPSVVESGELVRFARGVLEVNAARFGTAASSSWLLDSVDAYETVRVATFHLEAPETTRARAANSISFLFDRAGFLIEVDQTLAPID